MPLEAESEGYAAFAYAYDAALGERFFEVLRAHLEPLLDRYGQIGFRHLDLACGTGHALRWFADRGFSSCGVDLSIPMLDLARPRASRRVCGDLRQLPFRQQQFDLATSFYDSLNHFLNLDELSLAFRQARSVLRDGGMFWFDMNHPRAYTDVWSIEEPFLAEDADYRLEIATSFDRGSGIAIGEVSGWRELEGRRIPIGETHRQRSYTEREIISALRLARFEVTSKFTFNPFDEHDAKSQMKMFFVATAVASSVAPAVR